MARRVCANELLPGMVIRNREDTQIYLCISMPKDPTNIALVNLVAGICNNKHPNRGNRGVGEASPYNDIYSWGSCEWEYVCMMQDLQEVWND